MTIDYRSPLTACIQLRHLATRSSPAILLPFCSFPLEILHHLSHLLYRRQHGGYAAFECIDFFHQSLLVLDVLGLQLEQFGVQRPDVALNLTQCRA